MEEEIPEPKEFHHGKKKEKRKLEAMVFSKTLLIPGTLQHLLMLWGGNSLSMRYVSTENRQFAASKGTES